jgi:hypothetical protein
VICFISHHRTDALNCWAQTGQSREAIEGVDGKIPVIKAKCQSGEIELITLNILTVITFVNTK